MRQLKNNKEGSVVPLILFAITLLFFGALYTIFFVEVALPNLSGYIPASDAKTFIIMCIYALPIIVTFVGCIALLKTALERDYYIEEV